MVRVYVPVELERRVWASSRERCGYCLSPRHLVMARLEIEHIIPRSRGGATEESNLWLGCPLCNRAKGDQVEAVDPTTRTSVPLFNPRTQKWAEHFCWSRDGLRVIGLTPTGRATVVALNLSDDSDRLLVRSFWVQVGWHPPKD
jgi:HNH endonuclease